MYKNFLKSFLSIILTLTIFIPPVSFADTINDASNSSFSGLIPCGVEKFTAQTTINNVVYEAGQTKPCGWNDLISLINKVLNFILFKLAIPIGAIMFCYAGFLLITSGGDTEARGTAKKIALGVVKGLVFAAAAWLIVHLILDTLGYDGSWIGF